MTRILKDLNKDPQKDPHEDPRRSLKILERFSPGMGTGEMLGKPNKLRGVTCDGQASHPRGVEILLAASCYGDRDKLRPDEPVWLQGFTHMYIA